MYVSTTPPALASEDHPIIVRDRQTKARRRRLLKTVASYYSNPNTAFAVLEKWAGSVTTGKSMLELELLQQMEYEKFQIRKVHGVKASTELLEAVLDSSPPIPQTSSTLGISAYQAEFLYQG